MILLEKLIYIWPSHIRAAIRKAHKRNKPKKGYEMNMRKRATAWLDNAQKFSTNEMWNSEEAALHYAQVYAILHLADKQEERNRLAALTAQRRGLDMTGFEHLLGEMEE